MAVKTVFLHGDLDHEIYIAQTEGYIAEKHQDMVCKPKKSLHGLKQSERCWNVNIDSFLKAPGYLKSVADPCQSRE